MRIDVVRGDLLQRFFKIAVTDRSVIDSVHFSSAKQNIDAILPYSEELDGYWLNLSSEQTEKFSACTGKYDLTVVLKNGDCVTVIRNAPFVVWEKVNKIAEEEDVT